MATFQKLYNNEESDMFSSTSRKEDTLVTWEHLHRIESVLDGSNARDSYPAQQRGTSSDSERFDMKSPGYKVCMYTEDK